MNVYYIIDYVVRTREYSFCFGSVNYINLDQQIFKDFISNLIFRTNIKKCKKILVSCVQSRPKTKTFSLVLSVWSVLILLFLFTTNRLYLYSYDNYALASVTGPILKCCQCQGLDHGLKILKIFESDFECFVLQLYSIRDLYYIC